MRPYCVAVPRRIVLYGASGFTGRLVAEQLVAARARPVLAGPSHQNLAALGVLLGHGLDLAVADSRHPRSVLGMLKPGDVLVSTVGPFTRLGRPAVEAAIVAGASYIDCATETAFLRDVFVELAPHAKDAGVALLPGLGFMFVAGSLAAELALEGGDGTATRVDVGYLATGSVRRWQSRGLRAAAGATALAPQYAWRGGALVSVPAAERTRAFELKGSPRFAVSGSGLEPLTLPRMHPSLTDVTVFMGGPRSARAARLRTAVVPRAGGVPGARGLVARLASLPRNEPGPGPEARARLGHVAIASAYSAGGAELRTVRVTGPDVYTATAKLLAWAATRVANDGVGASGALGPVDAFGLAAVREACAAAGLSVTYG